MKILAVLSIVLIFSLSDFGSGQTVPQFRAEVHLVEVYARVFDKDGNHLAHLTQDQFEVRDNGELCPILFFEPVETGFSCAILLDRTGSILNDLPALKNSVSRFIDAFRAEDWIAVYDFNVMLRKTQDFTQNKDIAKKAVLRVSASGATALFDSISEVLQELTNRRGKKAIVVFTDGEDNSSYVGSAAVMRRANGLGIPLYFVVQGEALHKPELIKVLKDMSGATSGSTYVANRPADMDKVFLKISTDLQNSYLITYKPPPINAAKWRTIQLTAKGIKGARISSRERYFPTQK